MIIKPFNFGFLLLLFICIGIIIGSYFALKRAKYKTKLIFLLSLCAFNFVLYFVYKYCLSIDEEFCANFCTAGFSWYGELPLQLCNINLFLIPIAVLTKNKPIMGFSFFCAPLGAAMAIMFPEPGFIGFPLSTMRIFGFYTTHLLLIVCGICLCTLGFYKPKLKSLPGVIVTLIIIAACAHGFNTVMRATVYPESNYFFTYSPGGVSLLELFQEITDIPFLYELPAIAILVVYMLIVCLIISAAEKLKKKIANK